MSAFELVNNLVVFKLLTMFAHNSIYLIDYGLCIMCILHYVFYIMYSAY